MVMSCMKTFVMAEKCYNGDVHFVVCFWLLCCSTGRRRRKVDEAEKPWRKICCSLQEFRRLFIFNTTVTHYILQNYLTLTILKLMKKG